MRPAAGCARVAFRALDQPLGQALLAASGAPMHLAGRIKLDHWNGEQRVTFQIEDAARPDGLLLPSPAAKGWATSPSSRG